MREIEKRMRGEKITNILSYICLALLIWAGLFYTFFYGYEKGAGSGSIKFSLGSGDIESLEECRNKGLEDTAECLRSYTSTFYKYVERDDTKKSAEDIKENGGDCFDYAHLYKSMAEEIGYRAEVKTFKIDNFRGHAFAVLISEEGYCNLDQVSKPDCFHFG